MAVIGNPRSFHKQFKYIVEIDDIGNSFDVVHLGLAGSSRQTIIA